MTRSVVELGRELGDPGPPGGGVLGWQTDPTSPLAGEYVWRSLNGASRIIATRAAELLPAAFIDPIRAEVEAGFAKSYAIETAHRDRLVDARNRVTELEKRLADDPGVLADLVRATGEAKALADAEPAVRRSTRAAERGAYAALSAARPAIFDQARQACARVVDRVAEVVPRLPARVWGSPDPERLMVESGRVVDWGTLVEAAVSWGKVQELGDLLRADLGYDSDALTGGAPGWALRYRNWEKRMVDLSGPAIPTGDVALVGPPPKLAKPLRLAYAVANGHDPGMWTPEQVNEPEPKRRTLAERLRGLAGRGTPPPVDTAAALGVPPQ